MKKAEETDGDGFTIAYRLPEDYEECGECGYDHSYEYEEAARKHAFLEKLDAARNGGLS